MKVSAIVILIVSLLFAVMLGHYKNYKYKKAIVYMFPNNDDPKYQNIKGIINIDEIADDKVHIYGKISGLTGGKHGFHIHETGNLSDGYKSLKGHYNPFEREHGGPNNYNRHVGDLGNIVANKDGVAKVNIIDNMVKLRGKHSVIGRSIIIHEGENDLGLGGHKDSKTTGHAGKRLACGIIGHK